MSGQPYLDQDTLDQCREALRNGGKLQNLAGILRCEPDHLARLLGLPTSQPVSTAQDDADYLWRADALDKVL